MAYEKQLIFYLEMQVHFLDQDTEKTEAVSDWTQGWVHQLYNLYINHNVSKHQELFCTKICELVKYKKLLAFPTNGAHLTTVITHMPLYSRFFNLIHFRF